MQRLAVRTVVAALVVALIPVSVLAGYTISPALIAGQNQNVGVVKISGDATSLTLEFMLKGGEGWCMEESQVHVGTSLTDIPFNAAGNPMIGLFDYKREYGGCVTGDTYVIPLPGPPDDWYGQELVIAIHASVIGPEGQSETSWAVNCGNVEGPQQLPGRAWGFYAVLPANAWSGQNG